jgi:hypothetical protein
MADDNDMRTRHCELMEVIDRQAAVIEFLHERVKKLEADVDRVVPYNALRTKLNKNWDLLNKASDEVERVTNRLSNMAGPDPAASILPKGTEVYSHVFLFERDALEDHEVPWLQETGYTVSAEIQRARVVMKGTTSEVADIDHVSFQVGDVWVREEQPHAAMASFWEFILEKGKRSIKEINDPCSVQTRMVAEYTMDTYTQRRGSDFMYEYLLVSKNPFQQRPHKRRRGL